MGVGRFVVIEGLDGSGSSTQARLLTENLRAKGEEVIATHEPTDGPVGRLIRQTLRNEEGAPERRALPWMFAADRADHLHRTILPALDRGAWVVSDRYLHSSMAYQSLDIGVDEVLALNHTFRVPDLTIYLEVSSRIGMARVEARDQAREIYETQELQQRIHTAYGEVLLVLSRRGDRIKTLDGTQPIDALAAQILRLCESL